MKNRRGKLDKVPYQISSSLNHVEIHPNRYDSISANPIEPTAWQNSYEYIKSDNNSYDLGEKVGLSDKKEADAAFVNLVSEPPTPTNDTNLDNLPF